ncbi:MAG: aldo/keto reductase [Planctomycetota bacterium]|jgi:predicted aldo/keto reductase-like oxidoreductase
MKEGRNKTDRRDFLKSMGAAGLGFVLSSAQAKGNEPNTVEPNTPDKPPEPEFARVPRRKLGKTGVEVPCLALGTNRLDNQIILRAAVKWGVNYWDTANSYVGGNSELNIGKYLSSNPEARKELFIVSKASGAQKEATAKAIVAKVEERLQTSLKRMNTKYIDMYYGVHGLEDAEQLNDELKQWVKNAKERKLIRFFGFSTHKNMGQNLAAAAKLGWVDAIMMSCNFRFMQDDKLQAGVEACHKAGVGLIAMKTLGFRTGHSIETEEDKKLVSHFLQRGFTEVQAKIKVVLQDKRISTACVGMNDVDLLKTNAEAALDKTKLTRRDLEVLKKYADATCSGYCAGCAHICDRALQEMTYVSDIMRYLMYYNAYGDKDRARQLFAQIPGAVRNKLLSTDYSRAEARCPQHLPIGRLIAEAVSRLA